MSLRHGATSALVVLAASWLALTGVATAQISIAPPAPQHRLAPAVIPKFKVDQQGNLANWMVPGKMVKGMGGAMDLVASARRVIVAMEHTTRRGEPKILETCTLPLTGMKVVDTIITELAVIRVTPAGLVLEEIAPDTSVEDVRRLTGAEISLREPLERMFV